MRTTLSTATHDLITSYGNTVKNVIHAYRAGNARAAGYVEKPGPPPCKKPASASATTCAKTP